MNKITMEETRGESQHASRKNNGAKRMHRDGKINGRDLGVSRSRVTTKNSDCRCEEERPF
jgi:hypothetical protein